MTDNALSLDWASQVNPNLSPSEWPVGTLEHTDSRLILAVSSLRSQVGVPIIPSPVPGAHVRHRIRRPGNLDGDQHSVDADNPLSKAGDYFCRWPDLWKYQTAAQKHPQIKGIGIYTDMIFRGTAEGTWAMIHFDLRENLGPYPMLEWVGWRESRNHRMQYVYKQLDPINYHRIIGQRAGK